LRASPGCSDGRLTSLAVPRLVSATFMPTAGAMGSEAARK